jgi:hypothetical protein
MGSHRNNYRFEIDDSNREPRINTVKMPDGARYYADDITHIVIEVPDIENIDELPIAVWYGGQQLPFVVRQDTGHVMPDDRNAPHARCHGERSTRGYRGDDQPDERQRTQGLMCHGPPHAPSHAMGASVSG